MHARTHTYTHAHTHIHMHAHTHTHACTHTHTHTHAHSYSHTHSLTEFDASHNQLTYIPSSLFKMPELTNLQLAYNLLTHLPGDSEDPSAQDDGQLSLVHNNTLAECVHKICE